jgi:hypothetical protein
MTTAIITLLLLALLWRLARRPKVNRYLSPIGKLRRYVARQRMARVMGWRDGWSWIR